MSLSSQKNTVSNIREEGLLHSSLWYKIQHLILLLRSTSLCFLFSNKKYFASAAKMSAQDIFLPFDLIFSFVTSTTQEILVTLRSFNKQERALPESSPLSYCRIQGGFEGYMQLFEPQLNKSGKKPNSLTNVYDIHLSLVSPLSTLLYQ